MGNKTIIGIDFFTIITRDFLFFERNSRIQPLYIQKGFTGSIHQYALVCHKHVLCYTHHSFEGVADYDTPDDYSRDFIFSRGLKPYHYKRKCNDAQQIVKSLCH